ncbi:MAG: hypothetical protein IKE70_04720 [Bacilli bacterium]|nr:hypothetical protein [Bacilli bacterium]
MKKRTQFIKKNSKILLLGILIGSIISGIGTYAAVTLASSSVSYDNTTSGATATDVKGAIDELYSLANNKECKAGYTKSGGEYTYTCSKPAPTPVTFTDDSWDTIIANIQTGNTSAYTVGSTKTVDLGTLGTHTLRVANNSTPAECSTAGFSQTACGFVLEFADIITTHIMNPYNHESNPEIGHGNKGGWEYSEMRTYVNTDIYNALPTSLKNAIINTTVVSGHGPNDTTNFTTTDKLYLLSTHEVWEDVDGDTRFGPDHYDTAYNNTRQLDYYKNNNVTDSSYSGAIKQNNGSNSFWWLRSAYSSVYNSFCNVDDTGSWRYTTDSHGTHGVAPAFRIS